MRWPMRHHLPASGPSKIDWFPPNPLLLPEQSIPKESQQSCAPHRLAEPVVSNSGSCTQPLDGSARQGGQGAPLHHAHGHGAQKEGSNGARHLVVAQGAAATLMKGEMKESGWPVPGAIP